MIDTTPTLDELLELVIQSLKQWDEKDAATNRLATLLWVRLAQRKQPYTPAEAVRDMILAALDALQREYLADAQLLRRRFIERDTVEHLCHEWSWSDASFYRKQNLAQVRLASQLEKMEQEIRLKHHAALLARLEPASNSNLFGVQATLHSLEQILSTAEQPWMVAITGMGGMGKTTLADAIVRRAIAQGWCEECGWVTARQSTLNFGGELRTLRGEIGQDERVYSVERLIYDLAKQLLADPLILQLPMQQLFSLLKERLKRTAHLIVVDNLETLADFDGLAPILRELINPSKFLLTSRKTLYHEADIYHLPVPELSEADSLRLVRQEAMIRNLPHVVTASDDELRPIYQTVGGNPLALRLVTGQLHLDPLPKVLQELEEASGSNAQNLYTYLYRRVWQLLNESERHVLLAMPMLDPQVGSQEMLLSICSYLPAQEVDQAIKKLVSLSLVDCRVGLYESRYSIHSLTRSFLHKQVVQWSADDT